MMRLNRVSGIASQVALASVLAASAAFAQKQVINPPNARPGAVLSSAVRVGDISEVNVIVLPSVWGYYRLSINNLSIVSNVTSIFDKKFHRSF
jgi:hypothetical protein